MGRKSNRNRNIGIVVVALILVVTFQGQIMAGLGSLFGGNIFLPDEGSAPQTFTLTKRGTSTVITSATVYAWYDWNHNGAVDLGEYPSGEIETLTSDGTSGVVTTSVEYPINQDVLYQIHASGYEVETFARQRTSIPSGWDGDALSVANCFLTLTDSGSTRISINGELLVTSSTDYNYTLSGAEPTAEVVHTATTGDAGISEKAFVHWGTGKSYAATAIIATFTNQDFIDLKVSGMSGYFVGSTTTTVWWFVDGYFNDADVTGDERYSFNFAMDISDAGDIATIGIYNGIEESDLAIGVIGSALGTYETDIDIVA